MTFKSISSQIHKRLVSLSKVTRVTFKSHSSRFPKSLESLCEVTQVILRSDCQYTPFTQNLKVLASALRPTPKTASERQRKFQWMEPHEWNHSHANLHGSTPQLQWMDSATSMFQLSGLHGSAFELPSIGSKGLLRALLSGFRGRRTPLLGTANAPSGNRESPFWEQRTVLQGIANAPSGDQGRAALVAASMSSPTTERASWYALEW